MTPLQWLAPDMAREGLIKNKDWIPAACEATVRLFNDPDLVVPTTVIAALHPFAVDYIKQAPVLVVALAQDKDLAIKKERLRVANQFIIACSKQPRLADMMSGCGVAPQLRGLSAQALRKGDWHILKRLSAIPPSTLAQSVPQLASNQRVWLDSLDNWVKHMGRHFHEPDLYFCWAVVAFRDFGAHITPVEISDIADFVGNNRTSFNEKWTLQQAKAACDRWHTEVARKLTEAEFLATYRIGWCEPIDYAPLPSRAEIDGFEFIALRTGEQIFIEGHKMHNCLSTYTGRVLKGQSRLFSIRRDSRRVATLELHSNSTLTAPNQIYFLGQLRGPCNTEPSVEISRAANSFLDKVNKQIAQSAQKQNSRNQSRLANDLQLLQARQQILGVFLARAKLSN
jgi:hypothetical protein